MAFQDELPAAQNPTFINRCQMAAIQFCLEVVQTEPANTVNHENRARYANQFVINPPPFAATLAQGVISLNNSTDGSQLTDVTISNSIATIWNMYAGIV